MCPRFTVRYKNEKLMKDFHECIIKNEGSLYGNVEKEHENAIKIYLAYKKYKDYPTKISFLSGPGGLEIERSPTHKNLTKRQRTLIKAFDDKFGLDNKISNSDLPELIKTSLKVIDERSVIKWIDYLILIEFIRKDSIHYWTNTSPIDILEIYPELTPVEDPHD
jgi:hypothetical protein